jgi:hypothetical protein
MTVTYHNVLRATIETLGEMMAEFAGYRVTRLRDAHLAGETELRVESVLGLTATGTVLVEDLEGSAGESVAYTGQDLTPGAQRLTGVVLTRAHREEAEVVDGNRDWSQMDLLRRATLVDYAVGEDLDRISRSVGVNRPRGFVDSTFRSLVKVLSYMAKTPVYSLEMVLNAIYGVGSGWVIYESLVEHPCKVFITIPGNIGSASEGRTFMTGLENVTASSPVDIAMPHAPLNVIDVKAQDVEELLEMNTLPSAAAPAWAYNAEAAGAEGAYFVVISAAWGRYLQQSAPPGVDSGRYELAAPGIGTKWRVQGSWQSNGLAVVGGEPWHLGAWDGERDIFLNWSDTVIQFAQSDGTPISAPIAHTYADGAWHHFDLVRDGALVIAKVDGVTILEGQASWFAASVLRAFSFGFFNLGPVAQDWSCFWDKVAVYSRNDFNYWNLVRADGSLAIGSADLVSVSNPFLGTDVDKLVMIDSSNNLNHGPWQVLNTVGAGPPFGTVTLEGVTRPSNGYVSALEADLFNSYDGIFTDRDDGKFIEIPAGPNAGSYEIDEVITPYQVRVLLVAFATETEIDWRYDTQFVNEAAVDFTLVDAGEISGVNLILRDPMPGNLDVTVHHTIQESAQLSRGETVVNTGTRHPFYLGGVGLGAQSLLSEVKAAGVILDYYRVY